tara:strand:- start:807 stop:1256 length:450 start_codon:yes stop_codon:yes gene_type:complete
MSKVITKKELDLVIESTLEEAGLVSEKTLCEECGGTIVEGICEGGCGKEKEDTLNEATMKEKNTYCQEKFGKDYKDCTKEQQNQCDENCGKVEEGNEFTGALAKAKEEGKDEFEVDGKTYKVEESTEDNNDKLLKEELNKFNKIINYRK